MRSQASLFGRSIRSTTRVGAFAVTLSLLLLGCGGGGGGSGGGDGGGGGGGGSPGLPSGGPPLIGLENVLVPVQISLPPGFVGGPETMKLSTGAGEAVPDTAGFAQVPVYDGGPQLATLIDATGTPVLLGWVPLVNGTPGPHPLHVRSTAEALVWLFGRADLSVGEFQEQFIWRMRTATEVNALAVVLDAGLRANPKYLGQPDGVLRKAIADAVAAVLKTTGGDHILDAVAIDPRFRKSGIEVRETGNNQIEIENGYARRCVAFIERLSWTNDGGVETPYPADLGFKDVTPTVRASTTFGKFQEVLAAIGDYITNTVPAQPYITKPIDVPLAPTLAAGTKYQVTVVGPGNPSLGAAPAAGTRRYEAFIEATQKSLVLDFVLPMIVAGALPAANSRTRDWIEGLSAADVTEVLNAIRAGTSGASIDAAIANGDVVLAAGKVLESLLQLGNYWHDVATLVYGKLYGTPTGPNDTRRDEQLIRAQKMFELFENLSQGDPKAVIRTVATHITLCRPYEEFQIETKKAKISLTPVRSTISASQFVPFVAKLDEAEVGGAGTIKYHWKTSGAYGTLADGIAPSGSVEFDSVKDVLSYIPRGGSSGYGSDTVTVEAIRTVGTTNASLGAASATVEVKKLKPEIRPKKASLGNGDSQTFYVAVPDGLNDVGGKLSYRWKATGGHGTLSDGGDKGETSSSHVTYRCWSDGEGTDLLTVEVFTTSSGVSRSIGSDVATITTTKGKKTIVYGSGRGNATATVADGWITSCGGFATYTPKVTGALRYDVRCYGFNDTAYWGTSRYYSIDAATANEKNGEYEMGWSGGCGFGPYGGTQGDADAQAAADADAYTNSWRWAGMIVEVTVVYPK